MGPGGVASIVVRNARASLGGSETHLTMAGKTTRNTASTIVCIIMQLAKFRRHRYNTVNTAPRVPGMSNAVDNSSGSAWLTVKNAHVTTADNQLLLLRNISSSIAKPR